MPGRSCEVMGWLWGGLRGWFERGFEMVLGWLELGMDDYSARFGDGIGNYHASPGDGLGVAPAR